MAAAGMRQHPDQDLTIIGKLRNSTSIGAAFGLTRADRRRPTLIEGMTGTGKTTLMKNMIMQDIERGEGVCVIDPLGVFADELLEYIPQSRIQDVTYFNPADAVFPIGYNVLGGWKKEERDRAAASVVSVFNAIWSLSLQNPSIHSILGNGIAALMEFPNSTLLWLPRFLTDDDWRKEHTQRLTNPTVRAFWQNDFDQRPKRDRRSASEPVLNRVQELFRDPIMANIFGQERKAIDIPRHLAERRILIVNLAKAKIGSENASLLGAWEGDLLICRRMRPVLVPKERKTRFVLAARLAGKSAAETVAVLMAGFRRLEPGSRASITPANAPAVASQPVRGS